MSAEHIATNAALHAPAGCCAMAHESSRTPDQQFVYMLDAFRSTGGLARTAEILARLQALHGHPSAVLTQWIDQRKVICFEWQTQDWIPLFQFSRHNIAPLHRLQPVLMELNAVFDAWGLANWFATPNPWLAEKLPVEVLMTDLPAVLHAARADRYSVTG